MLKRIKRWFLNQSNSKLTTLIEHKSHTCMFLRNWGNTLFCDVGWERSTSKDYHCANCIFNMSRDSNPIFTKLIADLDAVIEVNRVSQRNR